MDACERPQLRTGRRTRAAPRVSSPQPNRRPRTSKRRTLDDEFLVNAVTGTASMAAETRRTPVVRMQRMVPSKPRVSLSFAGPAGAAIVKFPPLCRRLSVTGFSPQSEVHDRTRDGDGIS
jgi:hypothetical protein